MSSFFKRWNAIYSSWLTLCLTINTIVPLFFILILFNASTDLWLLKNVSKNSIILGNIYTIAAAFTFLYVALKNKPYIIDKEYSKRKFEYLFKRYGSVMLYLAVGCLLIKILNVSFYGKVDSNITNQKPYFSLLLGYLARVLSPSIYLYILLNFMSGRRFTFSILTTFLLLFVSLGLLGSRSALLGVLFFILLVLSWCSRINERKIIRSPGFLLLIGAAILSVLLGQFSRSGGISGIIDIQSIAIRLFINNGVLYKGIENFELLNSILLYNQPSGIMQNVFSFIIERTHVSSSYRLPELYGYDSVVSTSRGGATHLVAYAYGWLGLSFGLLGWFGLLIIYLWLSYLFYLNKTSMTKPSLWNTLIFCLSSRLILEFFMNLGMDSYIEKIGKGVFEITIFYLLIVFLSNVDRAIHRTKLN
jgi:hypothetical protein